MGGGVGWGEVRCGGVRGVGGWVGRRRGTFPHGNNPRL